MRDDFVLGRIGVLGEQRRGLHDLPGLAVAALRNLLGDPGALQRVFAFGIEAFDGGDLLASGLRYGGLAGAHRLAVEMDCAGATQTGAASEFRAGHLQMLADDPQQRRVIRYIDRMIMPIDVQGDHASSDFSGFFRHGLPPLSSVTLPASAAACRVTAICGHLGQPNLNEMLHHKMNHLRCPNADPLRDQALKGVRFLTHSICSMLSPLRTTN